MHKTRPATRARFGLSFDHDPLPRDRALPWVLEDRDTSTTVRFATLDDATTELDRLTFTASVATVSAARDTWTTWVREHRAHGAVTEDEAWSMDLAIGFLTGALSGAYDRSVLLGLARHLDAHRPGFISGDVGCRGCDWLTRRGGSDRHVAHVAAVVTEHVLVADLVAIVGKS